MAGYMMEPIASMVAIAEPLMAANTAQEISVTSARPPGMPFTARETAAMMRRVMPPPFMISPARMKHSIATRPKLSIDTMNFWANTRNSMSIAHSITRAAAASASTTGTPSVNRTPKLTR